MPLRVLLLDDRREDRLLAIRALRRAFPDVDVREVVDGDMFDRALRDRAFDVVVTDYHLRWATGLTVLEAVKAGDANTPVVMFTATASQDEAVAAMKAGLDDYVVKSPAHIVRLPAAIAAALERATQRREAEEARAHYLAEERRLREAAEAANRAKDEFLAVLSHELRTPLNAILGWAAMLAAGGLDEATMRKAATVIQRNARLQTKLVTDLLDVSAIVTGRIELASHPVALTTVVGTAVDALASDAAAKRIRVTTELGDPGLVRGDAARLHQVAYNLIANSLKFTPAGGTTRVEVRRDRDDVVLTVSDSGPGIAPEVLPYVFHPFRQADSTATRSHGGLGLGLALVRHVVERHGGSVEADGRGPLGGATFVVRLPALPAAVAAAAAASGLATGAASSLIGVNILVVDDEPDTLDLLALSFSACGARVTAAGSVREALEALPRERPQVVVTDLSMPGEDGFALLTRIRSATGEPSRVPVIALTAYARDEDRARTRAAGFDEHIAKPVDPADVCRIVADVVTRRAGPS